MYLVCLKNGENILMNCQFVTETRGLIRFCNIRKSLFDQQLYGPEIVGAFNIDEVKYVTKQNT